MDGRERLAEIMKSQGLNAKQLSEAIGVSAGTISNIMGGRNKPSLEFWQSVASYFPEINHSWLFLGYGPMYQNDYELEHNSAAPIERDLFSQIPEEQPIQAAKTVRNEMSINTTNQPTLQPTRTVEKIIIFYSDGTFEER